MIEKGFDTAELETRNQKFWDENNFWACNPNSDKKPFCTMMPPPNITGSLHMGHMLNNATTDFMCRYKRMKGFDVLWQPGTDHAAIAAQMLFEKELTKNKIRKEDLGREEFLRQMWEWANGIDSTIKSQLRRLGVTPDWKRERFTLDEGLSHAVRKVFVEMYKRDMIYRGSYMVNWCPKQQTVLSDLEVENKEENGKMYYIKYPVDGTNETITIGTTRPETMFGDMAVAVSADDDRYKHLVGKMINLPFTDRQIPIITDEHADPEKGTGAVKITPAHDFNDFEVGKRHNLPELTVMNAYAKMNENAPEKYQGMNRFDCRKSVIEDLKELGLFEKAEDQIMQIPYSERGGVVVEPRITTQWYARATKLADKAIQVVEDGEITFQPEHRKNLYMAWMREIKDWCISRQLWWGHQIPAWYAEDGTTFVEETEEEAHHVAELHFGKPVELTRDQDSLDTWFSSGLWPFSTLGWPDQTKELDRYYTTDYLSTAADIIFFWVARMIMMGLDTTGKIPFKHVYFHGLVRDAKGQKMSKTKGNGTDPKEPMDKYGVDALRYWAAGIPMGADGKYNDDDVKIGRKLIVKLWNATRFGLMQLEENFDPSATALPVSERTLEDRWLLSELNKTIAEHARYMDKYDNFQARNTIDTFFWNTFCDNYLEIIKDRFWNPERYDDAARVSAQWTLWESLRTIIGLFAPFIPFITEELYQQIFKQFEGTETLHLTAFPEVKDEWNTNVDDMKGMLDVLHAIRQQRTNDKLGTGQVETVAITTNIELFELLKKYETMMQAIARTENLELESGSDEIKIKITPKLKD